MGTKKTTTQHAANTLPEWLTTPYQNAVTSATALSKTPAIGATTQTALNKISTDANAGSALNYGALGGLSKFASGDFSGGNAGALTGAASGDFLRSNPFAQSGGLDTGYIDENGLNKTAAGDYLSPDSNPWIKAVADRSADTAQARINAQFGAAGRSNGSGLYDQLFGQGITDAANSVYASNYANERQLQQQAQSSLLGAGQTARESALGRQSSAYEAERARQQAASGGLINTQLEASSQLPGLLSSILYGDNASLAAGQYQDQAETTKLAQYVSLLSQLGAPYAIQDSKTTEKTGGLGATVGALAQLGGAAASLFGAGATGGLSALAGGAGGTVFNSAGNTASLHRAFG